jgi:hypothetical protein
MTILQFKLATFDEAIAPQIPSGIVHTCRPKNKQKYVIGQPVALARGRNDIRAIGTITEFIPFGDGSRQLTVQLSA